MLHLDCSICTSIFDKACTLPCGHCFCLSCITEWLKQKRDCPNCRCPASISDVVPCYVVREVVDALARNPAASPEILYEELSVNINNELGSGISGTVYLCEWADTNVALKLVRKTDQNESRLLQEVSHMASLSHPFVLRVFGITRLPKHIGILMELGSGHLQVPTSLSPTTLAQAIDICSAVKYLHSKGIVHHDIKPQNVILVNSQVKLADFGSARTMHYYTSTLEVAPTYTAPEAFRKIYGPAFDVYSLGILFYEMFANRLALEGMEVLEVVTAKQQEHLLSFPEGFPVSISSLINKCLSVNPSERPSTNDVLKELKDIQGNIDETIEVFDLNNSLTNDLCVKKTNDCLFFDGSKEARDPEAGVNLDNYLFDEHGLRGNDSNTAPQLQKAADLGDSVAMFHLGNCYYDGQGLQKDHSKAVHWYRKAADLGHPGAMVNLGICYKNGEGIREDLSQAVYLFQKAANLGHSSAMINLGNCYNDGDGVEQNDSQAVFWFQKAANLGHSSAMFNLGVCYGNGDGVEQDDSQAVFWFQKAAELGDSNAEEYLASYF
ncbi:hypothetical protein GEMRC1_006622 [Eukaryota sp. GEM-RC1]